MMLKTVATFAVGTKGLSLKIARGSVLDFVAAAPSSVGAIVNAANEGCLGGGGVDGAINDAGGPNLWKDREDLPLIEGTTNIRCRTGDAVITGPNKYGSLDVPYIVHAVGPNYMHYDNDDDDDDDDDFSLPDELLYSAYQSSLERCIENDVSDVAFSLLSAGIFRGRQSLTNVLAIGAVAIKDWADSKDDCGSLQSVTLCGFSERETRELIKVCKMVMEDDDDVGTADNETEEPDHKRKRQSNSPSKEEEDSKPASDMVTSPTKEDTATSTPNDKDAEGPADMEIDTPVEKIEAEPKLEESNDEGKQEASEPSADIVKEEEEKVDSTDEKGEDVKVVDGEEKQQDSGSPTDNDVEKEETKPDEKGEATSSS